MVNIFSIGIANGYDSNVIINCAESDAKEMYLAFEVALDEKFSSYNSIAISNINIETFRKTIKSLKNSVNDEDTFVIYFSGHGSIKHEGVESLSLHFVDDKLDLVTIVNELYEIPCKVLLILDTCHSEHAIKLADIPDNFTKPRIYVIASADLFGKAKFTDEGSCFTKIFCDAIIKMSKIGEEISILSIEEYFEQKDIDIFLGLATGSTNLILKECYMHDEFSDFNLRVLDLVNSFDYKTREIIWYSLENFPHRAYADILFSYIKDEVYESSWLVRRAIGSVASNLVGYEDEISEIFDKYIVSKSWMKLTIILIAKRYTLDDNVTELKKIIQDEYLNMDVVWLANLYYFDLNEVDYNIIFNSNLNRTKWGVLEIWNLLLKTKPFDESWDILNKFISEEDLLDYVALDRSFKEECQYTELYSEMKNNGIIKLLYDKKTRGRTPKKSNSKWLYSVIYGNWRDSINLDIKDYFENIPFETIKNELLELSSIPQYQMKMALFDFLTYENLFFEKHYESLIWGLTDKHPWVVREAIRMFKNHPDIIKNNIGYIKIEKLMYPGYLDLIIELNLACPDIDIKDVVEVNKLSESEINSLRKDNIIFNVS